MLKYIDKNGKSKPLTKYSDLCIEEVLDYGDKTLTCNISYDEDVALEDYIRTKTDEYTIKQKNSGDGIYVITAKLNIDELEGTPFQSFETTEKTALETANLAIAGTGWSCECSIEKKRTVKLTNVSSWEILKKIADTFILEMQIDSIKKKIIYKEKVGTKKGTYFSDQLNLISLESQSNTNDFYTSIFPLGKDGLTIESVNDGNRLLEDYTYSNKKKTFIWKDDRYTDPRSLKEDAKAKLSDMSKPYTAYSCSIIDLSRHSKKYKNYNIGDEITLIDRASKTKIKQRIKKKVAYPDNPEKDTCEVSNLKLTFTEYAQKYNAAAATVSNITTDNGTVDGNTVDSIDAGKVKNLDDVIAKNGEFQKISVRIINVSDELVAAESRIGILETTKISSAEADLKYASIARVEGVEGKFNNFYAGEFESAVSKINDLTVGVEKVNTLMFGSASGSSLTTEFSNSVVSLIGDAQIKDAMIANISASKITSGAIYTNLVKIYGDNSKKLCIEDNTIQMSDDSDIVRMQMGEDSQGRYNIIIRNSYEEVIFDAVGVTEKGYHDGSIKNIAVADNANIGAEKLNIDSLFNVINNDGSHTLKSSKIYLDSEAQTLDISFKTMQTSVNTANTNAVNALNSVNNIQVGGRNLYYLYDINVRQKHHVDSYSVNDGEITLVANGNDLYIGEVLAAGGKWGPEFGPLMDIEGASYVTINISNSLFNKNYYNFLDADKKALSIYTYWNISSGRITVPSGAKYLNLRVGYGAAVSGTTYKLRIKVEKGNKATDWTPAIEDTDNSIEKLTETVSAQGTQLTAVQGQISSKIWQQDITTAVNELQIEGRNLLRYNNIVEFASTIDKSDFVSKGKVVCSGDNINAGFRFDSASYYDASAIYTLSGYLTVTSQNCENVYLYNGKNLSFISFSIDGINYGSPLNNIVTSANAILNDGKKHYFELKYKTPTDIPADEGVSYTFIQLNKKSSTSITYEFEFLKLGKGNKATDWSPALEDVNDDIIALTTQYSTLEQTLTGFKAEVGATYATKESLAATNATLELKISKTDTSQIISMINASADAINITASNGGVNIKGNKFTLESDYTTITADGKITCNSLTAVNANLTGSLTATGKIYDSNLDITYNGLSSIRSGEINVRNSDTSSGFVIQGNKINFFNNLSRSIASMYLYDNEPYITLADYEGRSIYMFSKYGETGAGLQTIVNPLTQESIYFTPGTIRNTGDFLIRSTFGTITLKNGFGYELILQGDGNLVLYHDGVAIWDTGTSGQ